MPDALKVIVIADLIAAGLAPFAPETANAGSQSVLLDWSERP